MLDAYTLASRFVGIKERPGNIADNPQIMAMLQLDDAWPGHDEVPWCSAFANYVAWLAGLERTKKLNARSWLNVGVPIRVTDAQQGDIVVMERGSNPQTGHVGFLDRLQGGQIWILGGNQGDQVSVAAFSTSRVIGIRRLRAEFWGAS